MAILKSGKIPGATLLEVLVALILITVIFGIATMVYLNVLRSSYSTSQLKCQFLLQELSEETILTRSYFDEVFFRDGITVNKKVYPYESSKTLLHLHLEAIDPATKKKIERNMLVLTRDND